MGVMQLTTRLALALSLAGGLAACGNNGNGTTDAPAATEHVNGSGPGSTGPGGTAADHTAQDERTAD